MPDVDPSNAEPLPRWVLLQFLEDPKLRPLRLFKGIFDVVLHAAPINGTPAIAPIIERNATALDLDDQEPQTRVRDQKIGFTVIGS